MGLPITSVIIYALYSQKYIGFAKIAYAILTETSGYPLNLFFYYTSFFDKVKWFLEKII